jgi:RNA polymerase sigma factor (sigma-70 family)
MPKHNDTDPIDERHLVEAAKRGDEDAFACLFRRHSARTYQCLLRILRDREDAQDALQEAFLKAFTHLNSFEGRARFSSWLTRIAVNSALMELRKRRGRRLVQLDGGDDELAMWRMDLVDRRVDIHGDCASAELSGHLMRAMGRLKPILQEVLQLQLSFNYSQEEMAAITNISVPAVKSRIHRARSALRMSLGRQRVFEQESRAP